MGGDKLNVLIVDDSSVVRGMFSEELTALGYSVKTVETDEQAFQIIGKESFDIVFIDLKLAGGDGLKCLEWIQEQAIDTIPIIMTAYESPRTAIEAIEKGAYDYIIKPVKPGELEIIIKRALKRYEIEEKKTEAFKKRTEQLKNFKKASDELLMEITELKKEVNSLLEQMGKEKKYVF